MKIKTLTVSENLKKFSLKTVIIGEKCFQINDFNTFALNAYIKSNLMEISANFDDKKVTLAEICSDDLKENFFKLMEDDAIVNLSSKLMNIDVEIISTGNINDVLLKISFSTSSDTLNLDELLKILGFSFN